MLPFKLILPLGLVKSLLDDLALSPIDDIESSAFNLVLLFFKDVMETLD